MKLHINKIINYLLQNNYKFEYHGSDNLEIVDFCSLNNPKVKSITWIKNYANFNITNLNKDLHLLIITNYSGFDSSQAEGYNIITCEKPKEIFFRILSDFFVVNTEAKISPHSVVETKKIGKNVSIGHNCYINKEVTIGNNVIIRNNVVIECKTIIGNNTIINSGVVIGTNGFGFYKTEDGTNNRVPHFGGVIIGNNVEIGANTCIDRGTIDDTIIEDNVKIDNHSNIAHNVRIGEKSMILGFAGIAGSCIIDRNSYIAPGAIIKNQIRIGNNSMVGMGVVASCDVEDNTILAGTPPKKFKINYLDVL